VLNGMKEDALTFSIQTQNVPCTRGGIMEVTNSVFDPLGLLSPF